MYKFTTPIYMNNIATLSISRMLYSCKPPKDLMVIDDYDSLKKAHKNLTFISSYLKKSFE